MKMTETTHPSEPSNVNSCCGPDAASFYAYLILRVWLGLRALVTGIEKFSATVTKEVAMEAEEGAFAIPGLVTEMKVKEYGFSHYNGVPEPLYEKLAEEPLMPGFALSIYSGVLGYVLIAVGIMILAGICSRVALLVSGLVWASLTVGLILLKQDAGIAWLGMHVALTVGALLLVKHNRFSVVEKF
jgi:thiosulfate dehydrogenase [quinone] large subunit